MVLLSYLSSRYHTDDWQATSHWRQLTIMAAALVVCFACSLASESGSAPSDSGSATSSVPSAFFFVVAAAVVCAVQLVCAACGLAWAGRSLTDDKATVSLGLMRWIMLMRSWGYSAAVSLCILGWARAERHYPVASALLWLALGTLGLSPVAFEPGFTLLQLGMPLAVLSALVAAPYLGRDNVAAALFLRLPLPVSLAAGTLLAPMWPSGSFVPMAAGGQGPSAGAAGASLWLLLLPPLLSLAQAAVRATGGS